MIAITKEARQANNAQHDELFLQLVPAIQRYARLAFRDLKSQAQEEAICAVVAEAFCALRRLVELGKQDVAYATPLARFAVARYRAGRCLGARQSPRDVHSVVAQRRRGFSLVSLHSAGIPSDVWSEALADDTQTPVLDQVVFRLDFPVWLRRLKRRDQKLVKFLAVGNTPIETADGFRVSHARVSQLRKELRASWQSFQAEAPRETALEA